MKTAYPQIKGTCSIRLYSNIPFDNTYQHHSMISRLFIDDGGAIYTDVSETKGLPKERFINRQRNTTGLPYYYPRYDLTGDFNFDFTNGLVGSVVLELTPAQTNANYLRLTCGDDIYYYFITGIQQLNFETYKLSLELDVLMTYQDEFLLGVESTPVMTDRKHCHRYTTDGLVPKCADFKTGDNAFSGIKPSLIENVINLHHFNDYMKNLEGVMWLYICIDNLPNVAREEYETLNEKMKVLSMYKNKNKAYPLTMMCVPMNVESINYVYRITNPYTVTYSQDAIIKGIRKLVNDGKVHGAKISPYPPFTSTSNITKSGNNITITPDTTSVLLTTGYGLVVTQKFGNTSVMMGDVGSEHLLYSELGLHGQLMFSHGFMIIEEQNDCNFALTDITQDLGLFNSSAPNINKIRYPEPKLLFKPFKKYVISAQYSSEGCEFYPELIFSEYTCSSSGRYFSFITTSTSYIGDNNFYTCVRAIDGSIPVFSNYKYEKIGLCSSVNYIFPCGENALDVFNSTQAQSFYTSKVASGVTSGITMAGGIGSIILGAGAVAGAPWTGGMSAGAGYGLIAGGATAIAGGIASIANTVKSTNAKVEDLKNTPDSINVSGSNFITDECITLTTNGLPYIVVYDVSKSIKEQANDYFYNYGYQVARDCYFNRDLYFDNEDNAVDYNLFGRRIFNYIKLNEDITNKINNDIPLIAKQKLSKIFNNGITIWNFFGNSSLWGVADVATSTNPDKWFMKHTYDNTEY